MNEGQVWQKFKAALPKEAFATRIESVASEGIPDVIICYEGEIHLVELKVLRGSSIRMEPSQYAWHLKAQGQGVKPIIFAMNEKCIQVGSIITIKDSPTVLWEYDDVPKNIKEAIKNIFRRGVYKSEIV